MNDAKNSIFQLKSHRVNVPFNKDNFVDSYFLLSLSPHPASRHVICLLLPFALAYSHQKNIMYLYEEWVCAAEQFSSQIVKAKQTNKFSLDMFFHFMLLVPQFTDSLWCFFEERCGERKMKGFFSRLKFHYDASRCYYPILKITIECFEE